MEALTTTDGIWPNRPFDVPEVGDPIGAGSVEEPLSGGNATMHVVRVDGTVRKPWFDGAPGVLEYMRILRQRGVDAPVPMGRDSQGRIVVEFVDGTLASEGPLLTPAQLRRVGNMVRSIHDASMGIDPADLGLGTGLIPGPAADLVCHADLTPWNLVRGPRWVFIDWDGTAASTRSWDLAYSAQAFTLNDASTDPEVAAQSLCAYLEGYRADAEMRDALARMLVQRTWAMYELLRDAAHNGIEPWGTMFLEGHGEHWRTVAEYVERGEHVWRRAMRVHA